MKTIILFLFAGTLGIGFEASASAKPLTTDEYISLLQQASGDPDLAADKLVAQVDKTDAVAQFNLGTALMRKKFNPQAIEVLTRATNLDPKNTLAHANLGMAAFWSRQCKVVTPAFKNALALSPDHENAWYWNNLAGGCYIHSKDYSNAIRVCSRASALKPSDPRGELCLGKAHLGAKSYELALQSFLRVYNTTNESPYYSDAQTGILVSLAKQQKLSQAVDLLKLDRTQYPSEAALEQMAKSAERLVESSNSWWQN